MSGGESSYEIRPVLRYGREGFTETEVPVVKEVPVTVSLNGQEIITFLATDDALEYLAVGFLKGEGMIDKKEEIDAVRLDSSRTLVEVEARSDPLAEKLFERRTITSGCGKGTTFYHSMDALQVKPVDEGPSFEAEQIRRLMKLLHQRSELYRIAGGVHNAALCRGEEIVIFRHDIGRHNAIDKIHGECFLEEIPVGDKILVTTGRISSEILIKAGKMGVPVVVSRSTPTSLAIELAERVGITVVGLVRAGGLAVYTCLKRLKR